MATSHTYYDALNSERIVFTGMNYGLLAVIWQTIEILLTRLYRKESVVLFFVVENRHRQKNQIGNTSAALISPCVYATPPLSSMHRHYHKIFIIDHIFARLVSLFHPPSSEASPIYIPLLAVVIVWWLKKYGTWPDSGFHFRYDRQWSRQHALPFPKENSTRHTREVVHVVIWVRYVVDVSLWLCCNEIENTNPKFRIFFMTTRPLPRPAMTHPHYTMIVCVAPS